MSGTAAGGKKAAAANLKNDPDFYKRIGSAGGKASNNGGFAAGEEGRARARKAGRIGGLRSRRRPAKKKEEVEWHQP